MQSLRLFILLLISFPFMVQGQELSSSGDMQMRGSGFTKVVGENQDGIFLIHAKNVNLNSDFYLERFKHDLSSSNLYKVLIPKAQLEKVIVKENSISYFTQEGKKFRGEKILRYTTIASSNYQKLSSRAIKVEDYDFGQNLIPSHTSEDKSSTTFAIGVQNEKNSGVRVLQIKEDGEFTEKVTIFTEYKPSETKYLDIVQDDFDNTYILAKVGGSFVKAPQYLILLHNNATGEVTQKKLNSEGTWLGSVQMLYDSKNKITNIFSFFGDVINENKGYMFLSFSGKDQTKKVASFTEFSLGYKEEFIGVSAVSKGYQLSNFHVKGLRPTEDGGILVVAEKFEKVDKTQIEFVNGIAQPLTRSVYNFDDVMILSFNDEGELEWNKKINKIQNTMYDGGFYSSIQVVFTEYKIHVIYNDKMNTSGNVMQYSIDLNGEIEKKTVLKSVNYYQYIIPMQGRQVGYNRVVVPATINKDSRLIKFTYN